MNDSGLRKPAGNGFDSYRNQPYIDRSKSSRTRYSSDRNNSDRDTYNSSRNNSDPKNSKSLKKTGNIPKHHKISGGAIVAIVIGCLIIIGGIIGVVIYLSSNKDDKEAKKEADDKNKSNLKKAIDQSMNEYNKLVTQLDNSDLKPKLLSSDTKNLLNSDNLQSMEKGNDQLIALINSNKELIKKTKFLCQYGDWSSKCKADGNPNCGTRDILAVKATNGNAQLKPPYDQYCTETSRVCKTFCQDADCDYKDSVCTPISNTQDTCQYTSSGGGKRPGTITSTAHWGNSTKCPTTNSHCNAPCDLPKCKYSEWSTNCGGNASSVPCGSRSPIPTYSGDGMVQRCPATTQPCSVYCPGNGACRYGPAPSPEGDCKRTQGAVCKKGTTGTPMADGTQELVSYWGKSTKCPNTPIPCSVPCTLPCIPTKPTNGTAGTCGETLALGEKCLPVCNTGYTLSGPSTCSKDGKFTPATCNPIKPCVPTKPTDGTAGTCGETLALGEKCQPKCNPGYTVSGPSTCSKDGKFTPATCNPIKPCVPTKPTDGTAGTCGETLALGEKCQPKCNPGYTVSGQSTCSQDGTFTSATCNKTPIKQCIPTKPINGTAGACGKTLAPGEKCLPGCNTGYTLSGQSTCSQDGTFTPATCNKTPIKQCIPTKPINGTAGACGKTLAPGEKCLPGCNTGYTLSGQSTCSQDGTFTPATCNKTPNKQCPSTYYCNPTKIHCIDSIGDKCKDAKTFYSDNLCSSPCPQK